MRIVICLFLFSCLSFPFAPAPVAQDYTSERETRLGEYADRYGVENWPGKYGSVVAGLGLDDISTDEVPLVLDHERWLTVDNERVVVRHYESVDQRFILEMAVTRSCGTAHQLFFDQLTSPKSMVPLEPPALPFGRVRLDDIGDICFALPQHGEEEFHSIEFVRNNLVVRIRSKGRESVGLRDFAESLDHTILSRPRYRDWRNSKLWPSIDRFEASTRQVKARSTTPLSISIADPRNEPFTISWDLSAGGILEEKGGVCYYAEGSGPQTLTLLVVNQSGLAATSRIELVITK